MGAGRWGARGGRERREGGGEHRKVHTSTNTAQQDTKNTREEEEYYKGGSGNPKVVRGPQSGDFSRWRVGISTYNKSGVPCTTR